MGQEEVIYVVQGDKGTFIISGSLVHNSTKNSTATEAPSNHPSVSNEPIKQPSTTTTTLATTADPTPTTSSTEEIDYWDIFSSPASSIGTLAPENPTPAHPDHPESSTTRRPRPRPKPTTTTPTPDYEDTSSESPSPISDRFNVNGLNCGIQTERPNQLVLNGITAEKGQWPWQVAMFKTSSTGLTFQCGGTLISNRHVITAAHCVYVKTRQKPVTPDTILIYLGKHNLRSWTEEGQQAKDVEKVVLHPNYGKKNNDYDVAVLLLSTVVEFSNYVKPACLWDKSSNLNTITNKPGTVVGWGRDETGEIANELKMAKMPVVSQETCLRSDTFYSVFTSNVTYCAGYRNGTSVCNGDSGGGMFFHLDNKKQNTKTWYVRGVVSISKLQPSEPLCDDKSYVVFTDLAKLLPWVRQQVRPPAS